jgi:hypothetical protein
MSEADFRLTNRHVPGGAGSLIRQGDLCITLRVAKLQKCWWRAPATNLMNDSFQSCRRTVRKPLLLTSFELSL